MNPLLVRTYRESLEKKLKIYRLGSSTAIKAGTSGLRSHVISSATYRLLAIVVIVCGAVCPIDAIAFHTEAEAVSVFSLVQVD